MPKLTENQLALLNELEYCCIDIIVRIKGGVSRTAARFPLALDSRKYGHSLKCLSHKCLVDTNKLPSGNLSYEINEKGRRVLGAYEILMS